MVNYKKDFPVFKNNKKLVFLDSGASSQKPKNVIDGVSTFLSKNYANIHRGAYPLSQESETLFESSKQMVADLIGASSKEEIIYTYNATYSFNMLIELLVHNNHIRSWQKVLLAISEHHANIVHRQMLAQKYNFTIDYIDIDANYELDYNDFVKKYTDDVAVVSIGHVSNVTGSITDLARIKDVLRDETLFVVDGSQSVPHLEVNMQAIGCDFFIFTAHKVFAHTGIGILRWRKSLLDDMDPVYGGGDVIKRVTRTDITFAQTPTKFEPWTPNIVGAVSVLEACRYLQNIGGMQSIEHHEEHLCTYVMSKIEKLQQKYPKQLSLIGKPSCEGRIGVFSFVLHNGIWPKAVGEIMAEHNICVRAWGHCAHPLMDHLDLPNGTVRISLHIYNDEDDVDAFFLVLRTILRMGSDTTEDDDELC